MRLAILICAATFALSACDNSHQSESSAPASAPVSNAQDAPTPSTLAADTESASAAPAPSPEPTHNYVMEEGGEYGYQPAISEEEANNGVATKALEMVRYRGEKNGTYIVDAPDESGAIFRMECKDPCEYVKTRVIVEGQTIKSETVPNAPRSLMHAVLEDAMNGQLKPYKK